MRQEFDYVQEEIAAALAKGIPVIPVLIDGALMPRKEDFPRKISDFALHQKSDIAFESFGRDAAALIDAIKAGRRAFRAAEAPVK